MTSKRGITETGGILDRIVADKVEARERQKRDEPESSLQARFGDYDAAYGMTSALTAPRGFAPKDARVQIIAEIKKTSPSRGVFVEELDYVRIARDYTRGGAAAISVLTEENYFGGSIEYLRELRIGLAKEFGDSRPSLLRKDFLVDPYEVVQSRAYGADTILLIVAMLDDALLRDLLQQARNLDLDALVEIHTPDEAERAVAAGTMLYGVNNRDLHTFDVDLAVTERIRPLLPDDAVVVGESGIHNRGDVERLANAGVRAILVGEAFMTAPDIAAKMGELRI